MKQFSTKLRRLRGGVRRLYSKIRAFFFPHNVVKIAALPGTWCDRDYVMFHACFQVLVDFVELEQPYISWPDKKRGRITNISQMREFVNETYGEEGRKSFYAEWFTDQEKADQDRRTDEALRLNTQLLDLYEWYTTKRYEEDGADLPGGDDKLDEKLMQLIKLRRYLWT